MIPHALTLLFWLLVAHAVCDYPLQGDFLSRGKNHRKPLHGIPWWQCLLAHALIQAGGVAFLTDSLALGLAEFICHFVIDYGKSAGWFGFNADQALHVVCKIVWVLVNLVIIQAAFIQHFQLP